MADAVVGDKGDVVYSETGQNLTGYNILLFYITKPDGTAVTKNIADGVNIGSSAAAGIMYYTIESGLLDQDGTYKFSAYYELNSGASAFSQAVPGEYVVKRRNQST
jgi:hypothetical protein